MSVKSLKKTDIWSHLHKDESWITVDQFPVMVEKAEKNVVPRQNTSNAYV